MAQDLENLFSDLPHDAENHFRIYFFFAVLHLIEAAAASTGSAEQAFKQFPFLLGYNNELARRIDGLSAEDAQDQWRISLDHWELQASCPLPLRTLREAAGLTHDELTLALIFGVADQDARFGPLFEILQATPGLRHPTLAFLRQSIPGLPGHSRAPQVVSQLFVLGILVQLNPSAPRQEATFRFPDSIWNILVGAGTSLSSERIAYAPAFEATPLDQLIIPDLDLPHLSDSDLTVIVRGPRRNGRRTLLKSLFANAGFGTIELLPHDPSQPSDWKEAIAAATVLNAGLLIEWQLDPGQALPLPSVPVHLPLGIAIGQHGALTGPRIDTAAIIEMHFPSPSERRLLWSRCLSGVHPQVIDSIAVQFRFSSGTICQIAHRINNLAPDSPDRIDAGAIHRAAQALDHRALETLANRLEVTGDLAHLTANPRTLDELHTLARRCRQREALTAALSKTPGGPANSGVRAMLCGPSGCGKSLAGRLLGGELHKPVYQVDLASLVNKYIGETEKNLNRLFTLAEELDVILLLDEGDALMSRRTDVQNANDRYANLETNYLLQRIESFEGILIVTTNARNRIDHAFERRMDVVIEFSTPSAPERWRIWQTHLPAAARIDTGYMDEVASECELTGGEIRNAVHHATLLALDNGGIVTTGYFDAAVRREYRKKGLNCPLRQFSLQTHP